MVNMHLSFLIVIFYRIFINILNQRTLFEGHMMYDQFKRIFSIQYE